MTAILIVTIGTRDLMFQISSGTWYNVGNNQVQGTNIITEHIEVTEDLKPQQTTQRGVTKYLQEHQNQYLDRLKPVIIGKLLSEQASQIEKLYLIGTDQHPPVPQKIIDKDSIHSCEIIKSWVEINYKISTTIITIGPDGINPANFETMFEWWRKQWRTKIKPTADTEIWLGLKGGVGQTSEAGRISGLSMYGDRIKFFEFHEDEAKNQAGQPSDYSGPFLGTNYLWDRTQQQVLQLIGRSDYAGAQELLQPYQKSKKLGVLPYLLQAGTAWNRGEFESFLKLANANNGLTTSQRQQSQFWWWMAYEQAYLAVIRLQQNNTAEAMLHSFRAVEGGLLEWAKSAFPNDVIDVINGFPQVKDSILTEQPKLRSAFNHAKGNYQHAQWRGTLRQRILEITIPNARQADFKQFWSDDCQSQRNELSHRLGGIAQEDVFRAWGRDIHNQTQWENRILTCLNILTGQSFTTLNEASLFAKVQERVKESIKSIWPKKEQTPMSKTIPAFHIILSSTPPTDRGETKTV